MKPIPYTPSGSPTTSDPAIRRIPRICHPSSPLHRPRSLPVRSAASFSSSHLPVLSAIPPNPPHRSPPCCCLHPLPAIVPSTFSPGSVRLPSRSTASSSSSHLPILSPVPPNPPCQLPPCYRLHPLPATAPSAALPASTARPLHLATCPLLFRCIHIRRLPASSSSSVYLPHSKPRKTPASSISPPAPTPSALPSEPTPAPSLLAYTVTASSPPPSSPPTPTTVSHPLLSIGHSGVLWS